MLHIIHNNARSLNIEYYLRLDHPVHCIVQPYTEQTSICRVQAAAHCPNELMRTYISIYCNGPSV